MDMTLVVMAAGLGSRYGGVKQIERLGPDGEILMEYAIYDALRAGFDRIVLIIKPSMLEDVRALFGDRIEQRTGIRIDYAFQTPDRFTAARPELAQRKKPLGTVHAVLCARDVIRTPFAVINADDFYGRGALDAIAAALPQLGGAQDAAMVGYRQPLRHSHARRVRDAGRPAAQGAGDVQDPALPRRSDPRHVR